MNDELRCIRDGVPEETVFRASAANKAVVDPSRNTDVIFHDRDLHPLWRDTKPLCKRDKKLFKRDFDKYLNFAVRRGQKFKPGLVVGNVYGEFKRGSTQFWIQAGIEGEEDDNYTNFVFVPGWKRK